MNFDRCAILASLHRPQDALQRRCPGLHPSVAVVYKKNKYPPIGEYFKLVAETGFEPATSGL